MYPPKVLCAMVVFFNKKLQEIVVSFLRAPIRLFVFKINVRIKFYGCGKEFE